MFSSPPPPPPPVIIPAPPPTPPPPGQVAPVAAEPVLARDSPTVEAKRAEAEAEVRRRTGRQSTILSGALGDTSAAPIARRVLMGG
jgi:hypothetical protein